jgi:hypothetical protein
MKAPSTNIQAPEKAPNSSKHLGVCLESGDWIFSGAWILVVGVFAVLPRHDYH